MHARTEPRGGSAALVVGSAVNGLAAYGFIALGTRGLGAARFAPVAVVWVFWAFSAASLTFPVQHWLIRQMQLDGHAGGARAALVRVGALAGAVAAGEVLVAALWRNRLFGDEHWAWPLVVAGVAAGAGLLGVVRGLLAGSGRFAAAAVAVGGENVVRLAVGAAVVACGGGPLALAAVLVSGPAVVFLWPGLLRSTGPRVPGRPAAGLVGATALSAVLAQVALNGGPPVLAALGGEEAEVTGLFLALALFRAPYLLALGLTVRATAPLTRLVAEGGRRRLRERAWAAAGISVVATAAAFGVGWALGPRVIRTLFGPGTDLSGALTGAVAAGCVLALGSLALTVMLIAASARLALAASWIAACVIGAGVLAAGAGLGASARVVAAFTAAELSAVVAGLGTLLWPRSDR